MNISARTIPISGATTIKMSVFVHPLGRITPQPDLMTAAPAKPPISACDDDVGRPHHQVSKSQTMAPINPVITTYCVISSTRIMPLPMVLATAVPRKNAAAKLKNAAHNTASLGESTRVETTVAMLLAASWNPFRKSKVSATSTVIISSRRSGLTRFPVCQSVTASCVLQYYGFQDIGNIFRLVRGRFQEFEQFLDLDEVDRIRLVIKKIGYGDAGNLVGFILQAIDFDAMRQDVAILVQKRKRLV